MNTDEREQRQWLTMLSGKLIGACYAVSNELGCGFAEKVYENALMIELRERGISARQSFHQAQCLNYLRASGLRLCLLINFGRPKVEVKRFVNG